MIPVPTLERQKEIANLLDGFETVITNVSDGLPAEIKARHQQYEYYRNILLTFKELDVA
jgi:type I restriction enzyme S subunit